ncbi:MULTISPECIES: multiheme c-type cytochrome [unclassified Archaeoglobus]|jgi:cytochrome c553|uniref:multiheme c-type cytochrome n=1 Tax=unclassified Archaeoglobus TaxID=2643606 RepID=UPI0025BC8B95|nr:MULTISPECIES: multiheme c-type cytochrome [unclassified Archaeoglobus]
MNKKETLVIVLVALSITLCVQHYEKNIYPHKEELFTTSTTCSKCHDRLIDVSGRDVSIYSDWQQSIHSNAAVDPYFLAKLSSETAEFPELKDEIEAECARCHMPLASAQAASEGFKLTVSEGLREDYEFHDFAIEGVSCTICHQIENRDLGKESSFSGHYVIDFTTKKPQRKIYGPFDPSWPELMAGASGYRPVKGEVVERAELCAICHTLYTPTIENGKVIGTFPEQTPFLEWLNSIYSQNITCQMCHMKAGKAKVTTMPKNAPLRDMKAHYFVGANVQILKIQGDEVGAKRSETQLKSAARIKIESVELEKGKIVIKVTVENFAGHKFPTGFPSRRAFIHLFVEDSSGKVFESGKYYSDGRIEGEDEPFEPHHDVVGSEGDVQIYESIMVNKDGRVTRTLLEAFGYVKDNRILPEGFEKSRAHPDTLVRGLAATDTNFVGGRDEVTYIVKGNFSKPIRVVAELMYQPVSYPFLRSLHPTEQTKSFEAVIGKVEKTTLVSSDVRILD